MGLLNMDDSDSEDDSDDVQHKPKNPPGLINSSSSKHAALAAATAPPTPIRQNFAPVHPQQPQKPPSPSSNPQPKPPVVSQVPQVRSPPPSSLQSGPHHVPQPIAAPRPGYAAPIATLNLARPDPSATPVGRMPNPAQPLVNNPFEPPYHPRSQYPMPASPAPSSPHPLHPSVTPITPAFIRPSKSPVSRDGSALNVKFSEGKAIPRKPIIRGNSEETLLPGRGEKGDDFWRRFSMVAKEGNGKSQKERWVFSLPQSFARTKSSSSSWLHKMHDGSNRHSRAVFVAAIVLLLLIAGGVALGLFMRRNAPAHQQPTALGGSDDSLATPTASVATPTAAPGPGLPSQSTSLHVSPTFTLNNREETTALAVHPDHHKMHAARRFHKPNY